MRFEDFGLTAAQIQAAINGSDEACDEVLARMMKSSRFDEMLNHIRATQPHVYIRITALLRGKRPGADSQMSH